MKQDEKKKKKVERVATHPQSTHPIREKVKKPAKIAESEFQIFDVNIENVESKRVSHILERAEKNKMKLRQFNELVDKKLSSGEINIDEARFMKTYYGPFRASFRKTDREAPFDLIQYLETEQMKKKVLKEMGYASYWYHAFDKDGNSVAVLSGAFITGETGANILFCGFLGADSKHRDPALYEELMLTAVADIKQKTGRDVKVIVGEADKFEDFVLGSKAEKIETAVLRSYMSNGGVVVEGLRWVQVLPEEGHYAATELPAPEAGKWEELTLVIKPVNGNEIATREDVKKLIEELYIYYDVAGRTIRGGGKALEAYVNYTMEKVKEPPVPITDAQTLINVPRKSKK